MTHQRSASSAIQRLFAAALTGITLFAGAAHAADTRVGVSVSVSQPGFYGRVDLGDQPPPAVLYAQPMIIEQTPVAVHRRPIYLRVPPGHSKNWARYCSHYSACGQPVYFVRYAERMAPRYDDHRHDRYENRYERRSDRREDRRDDRRDRREDRRDDRHDHRDDHGRGHGRDKH